MFRHYYLYFQYNTAMINSKGRLVVIIALLYYNKKCHWDCTGTFLSVCVKVEEQ